ncbi:hypothetical protein KFL_000400380 [Klebsormidium nitens]|uniref:Malectin domain-containing protein n=1 Tax=Klebsormidium nitens TaxID=105231 RepID=A0A1Y1HMQ1_KLENI|nr:hypothetical protein KFL_000400380 [Klebsormidium nitens]|eukprot:GAQ79894.1 hypothetical protein KFL_000400380 [Klebsormidium nitens]
MGRSGGFPRWCMLAILVFFAKNVQCQTTGSASAPAQSSSSGAPSYLAINCGGLTPASASIPSYYGGVTYGSGPFYQPNNSHVSTGSVSGPVVFQADKYYFGTSTKPRQYLGFAPPLNVPDGSLYLTERYGLDFQYELNVPNGSYSVELFFAETQFDQPGARVFSILIQGQIAVADLDIFARVGMNQSLIITQPAVVSNGLLSIAFQTVSSNLNDGEAKVNAIHVYSSNTEHVPFPAPPSSYNINAGSSASYTAADGTKYSADSFYVGGSTSTFTNLLSPAPSSISQSREPSIYAYARTGASFSYYFNLPLGSYQIELDFVEDNYSRAGQRVFTVAVQGVKAFPAIDIIANSTYTLSPASAPAPSPADVYTPAPYSLSTAASVSNGLLRIDFAGLNGTNATVSAIRVAPLVSTTKLTLAVDCGSAIDVISGNGVIFNADQNYSGGVALLTNPYQVFLPYNADNDDFLYSTVRQGNFSYKFSVANGTYLVDLHFADLNATGPGQRVFDVFLQNTKILSNLDVFARTGENISVFIYQAPVNVTSDFLLIRFQGSDLSTLQNFTLSNFTLGGTNYINTLLPPFVSALFIQPGMATPSTTFTPAPAPRTVHRSPAPAPGSQSSRLAPAPRGPPPPPGPVGPPPPNPLFAFAYTPADAPQAPISPVPTFAGAATANPSCPANGAPPQGLNCTGPCPLWSPPFAFSVAINSAGPRYVSSCGVVFEDDSNNSSRCSDGVSSLTPVTQAGIMPPGRTWCRTNIKGPTGGYQYDTPNGIFDTSDPTIFQSEFIGYNAYYIQLPTPGIYYATAYFAEISLGPSSPTVDVNKPGLRLFYVHFNGDNSDAIGPIDPFALAGDAKFAADPSQGKAVQCDTNMMSIQFEAVSTGRDAPSVKGIFVYGPVESLSFNAQAPLGARPSGQPSALAPPPSTGSGASSPVSAGGSAASAAPAPA